MLTGTLTIANGRLIGIPAVRALEDELNAPEPPTGGSDRGEIDFTVTSDRVTISKSLLQSKLIAVHATGDIQYDGRLDVTANAGVIGKVESLLDELGDILALVSDRLLPYQISGSWSKPIVTPHPLGLPLGGGGNAGSSKESSDDASYRSSSPADAIAVQITEWLPNSREE